MKTLTYQFVLTLEFGGQKVKLQNQPTTSNGILVQQSVYPNQSSLPVTSAVQDTLSLHTPLAPSIKENTPAPATRVNHNPTEETLLSVADSPQQTPSAAPKRKRRRKGVVNANQPEPKTDRRWTLKTIHATQEEAERQADALEYGAGITRVYINPPGSARAVPEPYQKIAVFKSLNLMDPLWLRNRMGTWRPAYNARKAIPEDQTNRAFKTPTPAPKRTLNQVDVQDNKSAGTPSISESMSQKRKAIEISDVNVSNERSEPPNKHVYRGTSTTVTNTSSTSDIVPAAPHMPTVSVDQLREGQFPFESPASPMPWGGEQTNFNPQHIDPCQRSLNLPQLSPEPIWHGPAAQQYYQPQHVSPCYNFQHQHPGPMPSSPFGLQYRSHHGPFNSQPLPAYSHPQLLLHAHPQQQVVDQPTNQQQTSSQPGTQHQIPPQPPMQQQTPSQPENQQRIPSQTGFPIVRKGTKPVKRRVSQADVDAAELAWSKKMCDELRGQCQQYGLSVRGTKTDLVTRLSKTLFELEDENATSEQQSSPHATQEPATQQPTLQQPAVREPNAYAENEDSNVPQLTGEACVTCKKKKRKCDRSRPICSACTKSGYDCVYDGFRKGSRSATPGQLSSIQQPALQDIISQQPTNQQPAVNPHPEVLSRLPQNPPNSYQPLYEKSASPLDQSTAAISQSDAAGKDDETIEPTKKKRVREVDGKKDEITEQVKKKRGRPKKVQQVPTSQQATHSNPEPQISSPPQHSTPLPTPMLPAKSSILDTRLTRSRKKRASLSQDQAESTTVASQTETSSKSVPSADSTSLLQEPAAMKKPGDWRRGHVTKSSLETEVPDVTTIETEVAASLEQSAANLYAVTTGVEAVTLAEQTTEDRDVTVIETQPIASSQKLPEAPLMPSIETQDVTSLQQSTEFPGSDKEDTERSFMELFREASTTSEEATPSPQSRRHSLIRNSNHPENAHFQPVPNPPSHLSGQMQLPHAYPDQDKGHIQCGIVGQSNLGARVHLSPAHQLQQQSYPYPPSVAGGPSNFGTHTPFYYANPMQENAYSQMSYQSLAAWNGPLQKSQQGTFHPPRSQGPRLGHFSSSSPQPGLAPVTSTMPRMRNASLASTSRPLKTPQQTPSPALGSLAGPEGYSQSTGQQPYKSTKVAELEALEATLESFSSKADAVVFPDITARLFALYHRVVGILVLSKDKTELIFRGLDQEPQEPPMLQLQVSQIKENPNVSMPKSRPMELRIKYEDEDEDQVLSRFYFGQSEVAYQSANEMRAAIVRARIICRAAAGLTDTYELFREDSPANIEIVKPFQCEICKKRFKNKEGIKYHQSKSKTACNPDYDPAINPPKPRGQYRRTKKDSKEPAIKRATAKRAIKKIKTVEFDTGDNDMDQDNDLEQAVKQVDASDSYSSSDNSILAWAEKVAFVNPGQAKPAPPTPKKLTPKKSVPKLSEVELLSELLEAVINAAPADETTDTAVEDVLEDIINEVVAFTTLEQRLSGIIDDLPDDDLQHLINHRRSKDIILGLVDGNFGIFPGDKALWVAFVAVWLREHARSGILPTFEICNGALEDLEQANELVSTTFPARENDPMAPTRTIVALPAVDLSSPGVGMLRELIQMAYPRRYIPSKFAPRHVILEKLQGFISGSSPPRKRQDYSNLADVSPRDSDYDFVVDDVESIYFEDIIEDFEQDDSDSDEEYYEDGPGRNGRYEIIMRGRQGRRTDTESHALIEMDSSIDAISISPTPDPDADRRTSSGALPGPSALPGRSKYGRPKARQRAWKSGPLPPEEKHRRKILQANRILNFAPASLPNAETGAWDQTPLHVQAPRKRQKKKFRYKLPEPITYLQSENGAWDHRAYGHGAPPIHVRPARRADGNPGLKDYLKRISQGHRPILWPAENSTRVFLPAAPSKVLLRTRKKPDGRRKKSKREVLIASDAEDEFVPPKSMRQYAKRKCAKRKLTAISIDDDDDDGDEIEEIQPSQHHPKRRRTNLAGSATPRPLLSKPLQDDADPDFHSNAKIPPLAKINLRVTRKTARGGEELDTIQQLNLFRPRAFSDFKKSPNPGLVSLPLGFWLTSSNAFQSESSRSSPSPKPPAAHHPDKGLKGIEKTAAWEQGPMREKLAGRTKAAGFLWINHTVEAPESAYDAETMKLKWYDSAAFGIETLPYEDLDDSEGVEPLGAATKKKPQALEHPKKRQMTIVTPATGKNKGKNAGSKKITILRRRRHTAWPSDFDGVVDNIDEARKELQVELAPKVLPYTRTLRTMSKEEETRLVVAVIVVMTLAGGVDKGVDWVLITNIFPNYATHFLSRAWGRILKNRKPFIETLTSEFQHAFLAAYDDGEVPEIDYDHLVNYDWAKVIDWALKKIYSKGHHNHIDLPKSRKELKKFYDVKAKDNGVDKVREAFFNPSNAVYKRMEMVGSIPHTLLAEAKPPPKCADDVDIDELTLTRSWVRALVFTPEEDYDMAAAAEKFTDVDQNLVAGVKQSLVDEKIIKHVNNGRAAPGRAFEPTEAFFSALRTHITEEQFAQAVAYKKFLDAEFEGGKECVRSEYLANEGTLMCVTNLQAYGRIELKAVNVPMNKFGLTDGGYETKGIPKEKYRFEMDIYPTSSYLFDEEVPELQEYVVPPRGGEAGEIPVWYGILEELIPEIWKKVLVAVAGTNSLRAGTTIASLENTFKPALEVWEIWRVMEWGVKAGLMKRVDEDCEGWTMGEWWWAIVGRFCDEQ